MKHTKLLSKVPAKGLILNWGVEIKQNGSWQSYVNTRFGFDFGFFDDDHPEDDADPTNF